MDAINLEYIFMTELQDIFPDWEDLNREYVSLLGEVVIRPETFVAIRPESCVAKRPITRKFFT